jgi:hypothetical protein
MSEQRNADEDREIIAAATEGPWDFFENEGKRTIYDDTYFNRHIAYIASGGVENDEREEANATFIAEARQALPHWLERAVSAEQRVAELEQKIDDAIDQIEYMRDNIPNELWSYKDHDEWGEQADEVVKALKGETES